MKVQTLETLVSVRECKLCGHRFDDRDHQGESAQFTFVNPFTAASSDWVVHSRMCLDVMNLSREQKARDKHSFSLAEHIVIGADLRRTQNSLQKLFVHFSQDFTKTSPAVRVGYRLLDEFGHLQSKLDNEHCIVTPAKLTPPFFYYGPDNLAICELSESEQVNELRRRIQFICNTVAHRYGEADLIGRYALKSRNMFDEWVRAVQSGVGRRKMKGDWQGLNISGLPEATLKTEIRGVPNMDKAALEQVMAKEPTLNTIGFGLSNCKKYSREEAKETLATERQRLLNQVDLCNKVCEWLQANAQVRATVNSHIGSYTWKHVVEHEIGQYVPNGVFIAAAIHCGFKYRLDGGASPNACFNIKSIARERMLARA